MNCLFLGSSLLPTLSTLIAMSELALRLIEKNKKTKDTFLDLGRCGLENYLPEELLDCVWLERLNLGSTYYIQHQNSWESSKNDQLDNPFKGQVETRAFAEIERDAMWLEVVNQIRDLIKKDN